jgi:PD-(D/E)XK nuclease superfamily
MSDFEAYRKCLTNYTALTRSDQQLYPELLRSADPALCILRKEDSLHPPHFNIFVALGHAYRETSTHTALLAHLLDPAGRHAQGVLFLRSFLDLVQGAAKNQGKTLLLPTLEDQTRWRCRKEVSIPDGQVDILLRGPGLVLIIENKYSL